MEVVAEGCRLRTHLASPAPSSASTVPPGVIVVHGLPLPPLTRAGAWHGYPELADRIAADLGWVALTFASRAVGGSEGEFSPSAWKQDLAAAVDLLGSTGVAGIWIVGFGFGGALAVSHAALDQRVRGVASLGAPSDLDAWTGDARRLQEMARQAGLLSAGDGDGAAEVAAWVADVRRVKPLTAAQLLPPRPLLVVHGADDPDVPVVDARALADAAAGSAELRVLPGGGHLLRHDPRAISILLGWLDRQPVSRPGPERPDRNSIDEGRGERTEA